MHDIDYTNAIALLHKVSTKEGFLASAEDSANYKRVWARDGVICGLAALASGDVALIATFRSTLEILAKNQHANGNIPSNVLVSEKDAQVSYGGLAGRVDAVTWFIIGICQYAFYQSDNAFFKQYKSNIDQCFQLLEAWEFNNRHLVYVPLSGNWADEYITDGYVLYDQLLRVWALKSYRHFVRKKPVDVKISNCMTQILANFTPDNPMEKYHQKAYDEISINDFMPCSFSPAGYKSQFDAFANALALILNIGNADFQNRILSHFEQIVATCNMQLIPAFWPPVTDNDPDWHLLKNNCKYEFRNFPNEFHNGGSWPMVNGFYGLALLSKNKKQQAEKLLIKIKDANRIANYSFYENFNTETAQPNGVPFCAWSAAATILLEQSLNTNFKFLI